MATITAPLTRRRAASETSALTHLDVVLLSLPLAISGLGLLMIYDSSRHRLAQAGLSQLYYVERRGLAIVLGLVAMVVIMLVDYRRIRDLWVLIYLAAFPLLLGVL